MKAKAISYIRWSTPPQTEGASLTRQLTLAQAYADRHELELDARMVDPGVSSYRGRHRLKGALSGFLSAVQDGLISRGSYFLIEDQDRLSREEITFALSTFLAIINAGITIVTLADQEALSEDILNANPNLLYIVIGKMIRAHDDSKRKGGLVSNGHDVSKALARAEGRAWHAAGPRWLEWDDKARRHVEIPERVAVVRRIFDMLENGVGTTAVARRLNAEGIPSPRGKLWHHSAVLEVAHNRAVLGFYQPKKARDDQRGSRRPHDGDEWKCYPEIITPEQFHRVQAAIKGRSFAEGRKPNAVTLNNVFQGFARCAECNGRVGYAGGARMRGKLRCVDAERGAGCNNRKRYDYEEVERAILSHVSEFDLTPPVRAKRAEETRLAAATVEREEVRIKAERAAKLYEGNGEDEVAADRYKMHSARIKALTAEITALQATLVETATAPSPVERQAQLALLFRELEGKVGTGLYDLRARLSSTLRAVVQDVTFYPGGFVALPEWGAVEWNFGGQFAVTIKGGHRMYWFTNGALALSLDVDPDVAQRRPFVMKLEGAAVAVSRVQPVALAPAADSRGVYLEPHIGL